MATTSTANCLVNNLVAQLVTGLQSLTVCAVVAVDRASSKCIGQGEHRVEIVGRLGCVEDNLHRFRRMMAQPSIVCQDMRKASANKSLW
jgi:hypothetical protein